ncbi:MULTISPECIES: MarR family winged helix-turn-helix transcriptional regulator [unclassified Agrococcus]|uniref:MarR family winged helix-turn-helix transcriptional regulator n=1 Tax=unclassified Agrococcus TaxID=2615065 RepID=UPI00361A2B5B
MTQLQTASSTDSRAAESRAAWAIEELRLAEARLVRRRQSACGPSQTTREVLRLVTEAADDDRPLTPKALARLVNITPGGMTAILKRLAENGLVAYRPVAGDARSKVVVPSNRNDPDAADPVTERIRDVVRGLDAGEAEVLVRVLAQVQRAVDEECR